MDSANSKPDISQLQKLNEDLTKELENLKFFYSELESTNNHLVSATWRERDMKKKLADTINELNTTKLIVDTQNKRITESINYSKKLQIAINPTESELQELFPKSFTYFIPKDVISGDFPWLYKTDSYVYVAAVDCTGHGVPGAMMSMIGNLLLNDIVSNGKTLLPSEILLKLHKSVVNTLKQDLPDSNSNDGMDIALCRFDLNTHELVFSGAHRPLFLIKDNTLETISGDKFPIGGIHYRGLNNYTDTFFNLEKNDRIILFTDGLPDQPGGEQNKKLMSKGVKDFFKERIKITFKDLKVDLQEYFDQWKGTNKQIDDVLLIAIEY